MPIDFKNLKAKTVRFFFIPLLLTSGIVFFLIYFTNLKIFFFDSSYTLYLATSFCYLAFYIWFKDANKYPNKITNLLLGFIEGLFIMSLLIYFTLILGN